MKLVRVDHMRCGEWSATEYFAVFEKSIEDKVEQIVDDIVEEMIKDAQKLKDPPFGAPPHFPPYDDNPNKTVHEVQEEHKRMKAEYAEWLRNQKEFNRSFAERADEKGLIPLYKVEEDELIQTRAYWGHQHGLKLNYGA